MKKQIKKIGVLIVPLILYFGLTGFAQTITPSVTPSCAPGSASVTFSITGGTSGYTFVLTNLSNYGYSSQSSPTFTGLFSGSYSIYAYNGTDSVYDQFTITPAVVATPSATMATCTQSNGGATVSVAGGTSPYTYHWINSNDIVVSTTSALSSVTAGHYRVIVADNAGCVSDTTPVIIYASSPVSASIVSNNNICSPTLTASSTGGTGTIHYQWSSGQSTSAITISTPGIDSVIATDANGCSASTFINVSITSLIVDSPNVAEINPSCGATGSITIHMHNGVSPFTFLWSNSVTDSINSGLAAGQYNVTVTDANGCSAIGYFYLYNTQLAAQSDGQANATCGNSDGSLSVIAYNGQGTYHYSWSNGATTASVSNVPAGIYTVTVTDATSCSSTVTETIVAIGNYYVSVTMTPTACDTSLHTGSASATISGSGTAPYTYIWYGGQYYYSNQALIGSGQTIAGLYYGEYVTVSVTDANGCVPANYYLPDSSYVQLDPACYDHITGHVYNDANANCMFDAGELGMNDAYVIATAANGQTFYANPDSTGFYDIQVFQGTYIVTVDFYSYGQCTSNTCTSSYPVSFSTTGQVSSDNDFAASSGSSTFNLGVHPGCTSSAPGTQKEYWVYYYNNGITAVNNAVVSFSYDPSLTLLSTNPAYTANDIATHTLSWNVGTVSPNYYWTQITMYFDVPATATLGTVLYAQAEIDPIAGDCNPTDNIVNISNIVSGSHDPNEKEVSPAGNLTAADSVLTYTIRFQNNGNAPASRIVISDTLSANVNPATVIPGASSAPYKFNISGKGVLTFTFDGINLPDSTHGDSSKGFVNYTVHTKANLPIGSEVYNTAYIYFDLNPAVVTNTTTSLRSDFGTGIMTVYGSNMNAEVIPNPARDKAMIQFTGSTGTIALQITDALGNIIASSSVENKSYTLDAERLASGLYFYTAKDANGNKASGKISIVH
jgi:uncharacterized repeat protein (TIGR01451 family)